MQKSTIIWDNNTAISGYFDDVYFNTNGAVAETTYVFIEGNELNLQFLQHNHHTFIVGETGFGSGLSFLVLWHHFLQFKKHNPDHPLKKLQFFSVEKYPLSMDEMKKIHNSVIAKDHPLAPLAKKLREHLSQSTLLSQDVNLSVCYDDVAQFATFLTKQHILIDAWFFDGFSPAKNPDMWSESLFKACYKLTRSGGRFATFTAAGFVRRNLLSAGFVVNKQKGFGVKREMLIGYK